jgi:DNA helicase HerA-like ATPase
MSSSTSANRLRALRSAIHTRARGQYPLLTKRLAPANRIDRSAIVLGRGAAGGLVLLSERVRLEHCFVPGTTGAGKSKLLEYCIRQDIAAGRGVLVVDPHGEHPDSLYRSVLSWIKARGYLESRQVHLIDPSALSHTVGFNPLARPDTSTDLSVIAGLTLEAFSRAWGGEDTSRKPTIERVLTTTFAALSELNLSLVEAPILLDRADRHGLRRHAIETVRDAHTRRDLERLHELSNDDRRRQDFDLEVLGPINRLARFLRPAATSSMVGQTAAGLDFRQAFDEGHIILCNLSGSERIYETDADLLGRLVTRFAFHHAKRRRNPERPFFIYMDECHRYLSGDLENILAESRKYGLGVVLATQWLQQLRKESENMLAAVLNATNTKVVFRVKDPEEAERLAEMVVPFNLEIPVAALTKPTVTGYRRTRLANESGGRLSTDIRRRI